ncbi:unnamed protein product [Ambrosiozyma monospora]|uniref:Unnamed protein product n=1 Tax=Ambrosiozyma monospora TaxID=43982 RepID=A0A9W6W8C4_AMBMO|nr:unnamed protein product [Ambrosiozyma monospora]
MSPSQMLPTPFPLQTPNPTQQQLQLQIPTGPQGINQFQGSGIGGGMPSAVTLQNSQSLSAFYSQPFSAKFGPKSANFNSALFSQFPPGGNGGAGTTGGSNGDTPILPSGLPSKYLDFFPSPSVYYNQDWQIPMATVNAPTTSGPSHLLPMINNNNNNGNNSGAGAGGGLPGVTGAAAGASQQSIQPSILNQQKQQGQGQGPPNSNSSSNIASNVTLLNPTLNPTNSTTSSATSNILNPATAAPTAAMGSTGTGTMSAQTATGTVTASSSTSSSANSTGSSVSNTSQQSIATSVNSNSNAAMVREHRPPNLRGGSVGNEQSHGKFEVNIPRLQNGAGAGGITPSTVTTAASGNEK